MGSFVSSVAGGIAGKALGGIFGGSDKKQKSKSASTSSATSKSSLVLAEDQAQRRKGAQNVVSSSAMSSLPVELQELLSSVIERSSTAISPDYSNLRTDSLTDLQNLLTSRSRQAEQDISAKTQAIMNESRRAGEKELTALETRFAREAGGSMGNTFVTAATSEGRAALESQLASQEAKLGIQARGIQTSELGQLLELLNVDPQSSDVSNFARLLETLKGSSVEQTGTQDTASEELVNMLRDLTEKKNVNSTGKNTTRGSGSSRGFSLSFGEDPAE